jgi:hypothetical protein
MVVSGQNANHWTVTPSDVSVWSDRDSCPEPLALLAFKASTLTTRPPRQTITKVKKIEIDDSMARSVPEISMVMSVVVMSIRKVLTDHLLS